MSKQEAKKAVSPAIFEAQARLLSLRREHQRLPRRADLREQYRPLAENSQPVQADTPVSNGYQVIGDLPLHLGWGSRNLTQALRQAVAGRKQDKQEISTPGCQCREARDTQPPALCQAPAKPEGRNAANGEQPLAEDLLPVQTKREIEQATVKLHPNIGLGMLRNKAAAAGRIWLLLRWLDTSGSGRMELVQLRQLFCEQKSSTRICSWRQLRTLIAQGEGIYWVRADDRLWLKSIPKVAQALGVERLSGRPVALPVKVLTQGIGQVRAHLYASFHSGRRKALPISRSTLTKISQVSPRSQQHYEKRTRVQKQKNFAIGPNLASETVKEQIWQQRSACFSWRDNKAVHGAQGRSYLAWQLPNSYLGPHQQRPLGRQRKFNRELAVLFTKGMTGNDQFTDEKRPQRYFEAAKKAAWSLERSRTDVYWRGKDRGLWYLMEAAG